jgi:YD repeat-containing protein
VAKQVQGIWTGRRWSRAIESIVVQDARARMFARLTGNCLVALFIAAIRGASTKWRTAFARPRDPRQENFTVEGSLAMLNRCGRCLLGSLFAALVCAVAVAGTTIYQYDALGRLVVVKDDSGVTTTYVLDAAGNRRSQFTGDPPDTTPPSVPTGLTGSAPSSSLVNLSWNASTDADGSGLAGYKVYRNGSQIGTAAATSYADNTVSGTVRYTYQVAAYDNRGNTSALSASFSVTTPDTVPPSVPTGLTVTAIAYNQVNLSWNASPDTGGSGTWYYKVYRNGAYHYSTNLGETTSLDFFDVAPNTTYTYRVSAVDFVSNESAQSAPVTATTPSPPLNPPGTPSWTGGYENCTSVCITGAFGEILTWAPGAGAVPGYYEVEVKAGSPNWTREATPTAPTIVVGIPINTTRFYRVRACNTAGCSGYSTVIGFFYDPNP